MGKFKRVHIDDSFLLFFPEKFTFCKNQENYFWVSTDDFPCMLNVKRKTTWSGADTDRNKYLKPKINV